MRAHPPRRTRRTDWIGYGGIVLALAGLLWGAGRQWQQLTDRVTTLEREQRYLHGHIDVPKE